MAVKEAHREQAEAIQETTAEVMAGTKKRLDEFASVQRDFFAETSRHWLDRMRTEANLASEFSAKLMAVRSLPDAMAVGQEWASRRMEMMAEDYKYLFDGMQKFTQMGTKGFGVAS
jgi:hypothetical protein